MTEQKLKELFEQQCWYTWNEGFRYSYRENKSIDQSIEEANKLVDAFTEKFKGKYD